MISILKLLINGWSNLSIPEPVFVLPEHDSIGKTLLVFLISLSNVDTYAKMFIRRTITMTDTRA